MKINLVFFGNLAEIGKNKSIEIETVRNTTDLVNYLNEQFPPLKEKKFLIAINQKMAKGTQELKEGDEVAFLPPFSGG